MISKKNVIYEFLTRIKHLCIFKYLFKFLISNQYILELFFKKHFVNFSRFITLFDFLGQYIFHLQK